MAMGSGSNNNGTNSSGASSSGASSSGVGGNTSNNVGGSVGGEGNGGGAGGNSGAGSSSNGNSQSNSAAAGTSSSDSKQSSGLASSQNSGSNTANSSSAAQSGGVMGGLQAATQAARDSKNGGISSTQQGIANAVANAFGTSKVAATDDGTRSPMATPGQKDAYNAGYRNETNAGMTRAAFGALPGVGSLVGEGIARTAMAEPAGLADNEKAAYSTGVTGAKDAGIGNTARTVGSLAGGVLGGPLGSALASALLGGYSYSQQRAANPAAFAGEGQSYSGPVSGSMAGALSVDGNSGNTVAPTSSMATALSSGGSFGLPSDYGDAYNSYQNMNLGRL